MLLHRRAGAIHAPEDEPQHILGRPVHHADRHRIVADRLTERERAPHQIGPLTA
ncbi:MAG TPA: hypothetical protein VIK91_09030 [Nannocystis sp.]